MADAMDELIARGLPAINPIGDYYKLQNQQLEQQSNLLALAQARQMGPLRIQAAQQLAQENQLKLQDTQDERKDIQTVQQISNDPAFGGNPDKIATALIGKVRPKAYWDYRNNVSKTHTDKIAVLKSAAEVAKMNGEHVSNLAFGAAQNGFSPHAFGGYLDQAVADGSMTEDQAKEIERQHREAPEPDAFVKTHLLSRLTPADRTAYDASLGAGQKLETDKRTADKAKAIDDSYQIQSDDGVKAWKAKWPQFAGIVDDTYKPDTRQAIQFRLGVPLEKQGEVRLQNLKADMGMVGNSEFDQFLVKNAGTYTGPDGKPKTPAQLTAPELNGLIQKYKEINADPEVRAAALAQKNMAVMLAQMQMGGALTDDMAQQAAEDVSSHRMSPEQMMQLFGDRRFGGVNKQKVYGALKKLDPTMNLEEASAEYALVKSPGFQNTIRYMDSVQESIPRLLEASKRLNQGKVRSINSLVALGKDQFNNVDLKKFHTDRLLVADEIAKLLQGGGSGSGTSDAKLNQAATIARETDDPAALAGAMEEVQALIGYRRNALTRGTYMENRGPAAAGLPTITTKEARDKLPAGTKYRDSKGNVATKQ